jgi:hypothetical protein
MKLVRKKAPGELWRQWDPGTDDPMDADVETMGVETMDVEPVEAGDGSNLPGIPDGYEAVRFGCPDESSDELFVDNYGKVHNACFCYAGRQYLIVRPIPPKIRTVKVAEFAVWHSEPDAATVATLSDLKAMECRMLGGANTRRISDWREIEIWEEDQ